jgi:RimJ/RimL family protein N-acetyltransferase
MTALPGIDTERLTLRVHRVDDFPDSVTMWADPAVTRHIGGKPFGRDEVWTKLLRYLGHWAVMGFGYWVARERATGRFVGEVGLADFKRDIEPSVEGVPEAGWVLASWAHGKGFATEAVRAVLAWGETQLRPARMVCLIDPDNLASIRVAEKCGFQELVRTTYKGHPSIILERSGRPESGESARGA